MKINTNISINSGKGTMKAKKQSSKNSTSTPKSTNTVAKNKAGVIPTADSGRRELTEAEKRGDRLRLTRMPKIILTRLAYDKIFAWTDYCDYEVSCLGVTEFNKEKHAYVIHDVFLVKQTVSGASTIMCPEDQARVEYLASKNYPELHLNAWIHSHVNMGVFWSGTDDSNIITQSHIGTNDEGLCVAVVVNKRRDMKGGIAYNSNNTFAPSFFAEDVAVVVEDHVINEEYLKDFDSLVIAPKFEKTSILTHNARGTLLDSSDDWDTWNDWGDDYANNVTNTNASFLPKGNTVVHHWYPDDILMHMLKDDLIEELLDAEAKEWLTEEELEDIYTRWHVVNNVPLSKKDKIV